MSKQSHSGRQSKREAVQVRMLREFDKRPKGKKSSGDVCCRILRSFLAKELGPHFKLSEPNAFISGDSKEYDLLVLASGARRLPHTNEFDSGNVKCGIEVKANGLSYSGKTLREDARRQREAFSRSRKKFPSIQFVYFTFQESTPKKAGGVDLWKWTRRWLKPFRAFCMRNRIGGELYLDKWGWTCFVDYIKSVL